MRSLLRIFLLLLFVFFPVAIEMVAQDLPDEAEKEWCTKLNIRLDQLCSSPMFRTSQFALCVYDLTSDTLLYERNAQQLMRPASTMKLLTAITGLSVLGGSYTFQTRLYHTGSVCDGVLQGDVYVVGGFDPRFGKDDMISFVEAIQSLGIDSIAGMLYGDVSFKDTLRWGEGWCWDDEMECLTPLLYNEKDQFLFHFRSTLSDYGIGINLVDTLFVQTGRCPSDAVLITCRSHSIDQILHPMMKESDNLYAESLFYQLASPLPDASARDAVRPIKHHIRQMGLDPEAYRIADGSGLSLYSYLSAELEVAFLRYAYQHSPIFVPLYASLPIAGVDGTLKHRMRRGAAYKRVRAKTGSVRSVSTLAGYATASNGHQLAFCIFNQGLLRLKPGRDFQDSVCEVLCR